MNYCFRMGLITLFQLTEASQLRALVLSFLCNLNKLHLLFFHHIKQVKLCNKCRYGYLINVIMPRFSTCLFDIMDKLTSKMCVFI